MDHGAAVDSTGERVSGKAEIGAAHRPWGNSL